MFFFESNPTGALLQPFMNDVTGFFILSLSFKTYIYL